MKRLLASVLAGSLSWATAIHADDIQGRPVNGVTLGRPVAVRLGAPIPTPRVDAALMRTSFQAPALLARPVVRAQEADGRPTWSSGTERSDAGRGAGGSSFASLGSPLSPVRATGFAAEPPTAEAPAPRPVSGPVESVPLSSGAMMSGPAIAADDGDGFLWDGPGPWGRGRRFYGSAEYLLWWIRGQSIPPLITTGPAPTGQTLNLVGALGQPGTGIVFGGGNQRYNPFSGGRFTVGWWCDDCQTKALEFSYFFLGQNGFNFTANSNQFPVLARPFFNINQGIPFSEVTAAPGLATGNVNVNGQSSLWGAEANFRCNACCDCGFRFDWLYGFRYLNLTENLNITESINALPTVPVVGGDTILVSDRFGTRNNFFGGQIGALMGFRVERWTLDLTAKLAIGDTHQVLNIEGNQAIRTPTGQVTVFPGGLLALSSNSGRFVHDRFTLVPEWGAKIGYNVTDQLRLTLGYTFIYWSSVIRPGDQIDQGLDINQIPNFARGPAATQLRPLPLFHQTSFWAQGLSLGLEYVY